MFLNVKKDSSLYVNMGNALVKAAHGLSIGEKRLLMLAISKLDSKAKPAPENMIVQVRVSEFIDAFGVAANTGYEEVKAASERLMDRRIRFFHDENGLKLETRMQWIGRATYADSEGKTELAFWHELSPMLFGLKDYFTSYRLSRAGKLRSMYSWRLFELIMQFRKTGVLSIGIEEFNQVLEVPDTYKQDFSLLRMRVIEPAVKEIREKDGLAVKWEAVTAGRKVKVLKFTFPIEQQAALPLPTATTAPAAKRKTDAELETIDKPMTKQEAQQAASQIIGKVKSANAEVMPLNELQSRIESAKNFAKLTGDQIDKYLTDKDKEALQHYKIKI